MNPDPEPGLAASDLGLGETGAGSGALTGAAGAVPAGAGVWAGEREGGGAAAARVAAAVPLFLWRSPVAVFQLILVVVLALGLGLHPAFFAIFLFDGIRHSSSLGNVLESVTRNTRTLALTAALLVVILYLYALLAFLRLGSAFQSEFGSPAACASIPSCFLLILGSLPHGEVLETLSYLSGGTLVFLFQVSFYAVVVVILLSVLFGIIIDTFGQLRDERQAQTNALRSRCFVCALPGVQFDREGIGFAHHIRTEHSPAAYLDYVVHLHEKHEADGGDTEFTGDESFFWARLAARDVGLFPLRRALALQRSAAAAAVAGEAARRAKLPARVTGLFAGVAGQVAALQQGCEGLSQQLAVRVPRLARIESLIQQQAVRSEAAAEQSAQLIAEYLEQLTPAKAAAAARPTGPREARGRRVSGRSRPSPLGPGAGSSRGQVPRKDPARFPR